MNNLTSDFIAIDTNVFEHVLDRRVNDDDPIDKLLTVLSDDNVSLLVDCGGRIEGQYARRLKPKFKKSWDEGYARYVFKLCFGHSSNPRKRVNVDLRDDLMTIIKKILKKSETIDKIMVYVAFKEGRVLITNDKNDIVEGPSKERGRRCARLKKAAKKVRRKFRARADDKSDILTSQQAYGKL